MVLIITTTKAHNLRLDQLHKMEFKERDPHKLAEIHKEIDRLSAERHQLLRQAAAAAPPISSTPTREVSPMVDESPIQIPLTEWPASAKLVKERVALVEDALFAAARRICLGDPKVLVSALGKVLAKVRDEKQVTKTPAATDAVETE